MVRVGMGLVRRCGRQAYIDIIGNCKYYHHRHHHYHHHYLLLHLFVPEQQHVKRRNKTVERSTKTVYLYYLLAKDESAGSSHEFCSYFGSGRVRSLHRGEWGRVIKSDPCPSPSRWALVERIWMATAKHANANAGGGTIPVELWHFRPIIAPVS